MRIVYTIADPSKNITALVSSSVSPEMRPFVAQKIMDREPLAEQVGFVKKDGNGRYFLHMAGGEFCGNATISAASLFLRDYEPNNGVYKKDICLYVSGATNELNVHFDNVSEPIYECTLEFPKILSVGKKTRVFAGKKYELFAVEAEGIAHDITLEAMAPDEAENALKYWCRQDNRKAMGLMQYDIKTDTLKPLVYVPGIDTMFWENSCASGTAALCEVLCFLGLNCNREIKEPGGILKIAKNEKGNVLLTNRVILSENKLFEI